MQNQDLPEISFFDQRIQLWVQFVDQCHDTQVRKYTGLRYVNHLIAVARLVNEYTEDQRYLAIALGHDLYEDTDCQQEALMLKLEEIGFPEIDAQFIHEKISELSDEFVKANYPEWNRRKRKKAEAERLWKISSSAQTVKYADIIDNSLDLSKNDQGFARRYLEEVQLILQGMDKGHPKLYKRAVRTVEDCIKRLK